MTKEEAQAMLEAMIAIRNESEAQIKKFETILAKEHAAQGPRRERKRPSDDVSGGLRD